MGGRISLVSNIGWGSIFQFTVRVGAQAGSQPMAKPEGIEQLERQPVLVVDDNATSARILTEIFSYWGLEPVTEKEGASAIARMAEARDAGRPFPLVVLDAHMPDIDGFDIAEKVLEDRSLAERVMLLVSTANRNQDMERCQALGVAAAVTKPVRISELAGAISKMILPRSVRMAPSPRAAVPPDKAARKPLRILLTEDNLVNQKVARRILEKEGHTVRVCQNGREAVDAIREDSFDLIIMDIQMPVMDGYEAATAIREWERFSGRHTPILALTARALKGDRERCIAAGMDGYVTKPIRPQTLLDAVGEFPPGDQTTVEPAGEAVSGAPAPRQAATTACFDLAAALDLVDGDIELLREMTVVFIEEVPRLMSGIEDALASEDVRSLERAAHALKGTVGSFAANRAYEVARRVEEAAREGRDEEARNSVAALREEMERLIPALTNLPTRVEDPQPAGG
jgi:CheY-like chemotaxis protein